MIRNLDYNWQTATNIVLVNNNNRGGGAAATMMGADPLVAVGGAGDSDGGAMTTTATLAANGSNNAICSNNNNNEDGFGDKNYAAATTTAVVTTSAASLAGVGGGGGGGMLVTLVHGGRDGGSGLPKIVKIVPTKPKRTLSSGNGGRQSTVIVANDKGLVTGLRGAASTRELLKEAIEEEEVRSEIVVEEGPIHTSREEKKGAVASGSRSTLTPNKSNNSSFEESAAAGSATASPDHHARRPMNAFLIFCKKHRPIVREKYPNLENRAITKILGDWWANLEDKDQDPFKSLASNYKDAFLNANPNFKWYKLPAPPLRTLSTRPTNSDRSYGDLLAHGLAPATASINKSPTTPTKRVYEERYQEVVAAPAPVHGNRRRALKNNIQLFKLADENQMGGLSNLMAMGHGTVLTKLSDNNNNNSGIQELLVPDDADDLIIDESAAAEEPFANMRTHAARMEVTPKRKLLDIHSEFQAMKRAKKRADYLESAVASAATGAAATTSGLVGEETSAGALGPKSSRACKGKKYLEFFKQSKTTPQVTTTVISPPQSPIATGLIGNGPQLSPTSVILQSVGFPHNGYCKPQPSGEGSNKPANNQQTDDPDMEIDIENETAEGKPEGATAATGGEIAAGHGAEKMDQNNGKLFDASDFELDSKIIALPALSLDTYLMRKRETKKKKKIGGKGKNYTKKQPSGPTIQEVKEAKQKSMVGSQKRKARKESITRRDVNSVPTTTIVGEDPATAEEGNVAAGNTSDLFILATLAELQQ